MKNGSTFKFESVIDLEGFYSDSFNLYCVIGSRDTLVLHRPFVSRDTASSMVLCMTPSLTEGMLQITSVAGPIIEKLAFHSGIYSQKEIIPGSILIDTYIYDIEDELMNLYRCGGMNESINRVMAKCGITKYSVPKHLRNAKLRAKYKDHDWFPIL